MMRRSALALGCAVFLVACSGSAADRSTGETGSTEREAAEPTSLGQGLEDPSSAPSSTTTSPLPVAEREALDLLGALGPGLPIPDEARPCVAEGLADDPTLAADLRRARKRGVAPDGVMDLAAGCMQELHALPAFLDGLEGSVDGGLSADQRACVEKGFRALDPDVLEAALADAMGATRGVDAAGELGSMVEECGVENP